MPLGILRRILSLSRFIPRVSENRHSVKISLMLTFINYPCTKIKSLLLASTRLTPARLNLKYDRS